MSTEQQLLATAVSAVQAAAAYVSRPAAVPTTADELFAALRANDEAVSAVLRPALLAALPGSRWTSDEHGSGPMPDGDWWVVDPVGGNMNAVQGMPDWNIGVSLVRDGHPVLAVLHAPATGTAPHTHARGGTVRTPLPGAQSTSMPEAAQHAPTTPHALDTPHAPAAPAPAPGETFTAIAGVGAWLDGVPLRVSGKTDLGLALTGTGQAKPDRDPGRVRRVGDAIAAMMERALYVRSSVPVGHQLVQVAAGRMDVHWQFDNLRSHIAPVLIVREAGATVTDLDGKPWAIDSDAYVAAAPGLHAAALDVLARVR